MKCSTCGLRRIRLREVFGNAVSWNWSGSDSIQTDDQVLVAERHRGNLRKILLAARKVHSGRDYARLSEPILLELQQREQEILEYLTSEIAQPLAS
jgi:hypothetical protein